MAAQQNQATVADGRDARPWQNKVKLTFEVGQVCVIFLVMMFAAMMFADMKKASVQLNAARFKDTKYESDFPELNFDEVSRNQAYSEELCGAQSSCAQEAEASWEEGSAKGTDKNGLPIVNHRKFWTDGAGYRNGEGKPGASREDTEHDPDGFRCTICDATWDPNKEGGGWVRNTCKRCDIQTSWKFKPFGRRLPAEEVEQAAGSNSSHKGSTETPADKDGKKTTGRNPWARDAHVPTGWGPRNDPEFLEKKGVDGVADDENVFMAVPGYMLLSNADETQMSSCQVHYNSNLLLGWGKTKVEFAKVNVSLLSTGKTFGQASVGMAASSGGCPASKSYKEECSYISAKDWDVYLAEGYGSFGHYDSSELFIFASGLLPIWFLLKVVSMDPEVFDMVCDKMFCGKCNLRGDGDKKKGHMASLLEIKALPSWARAAAQEFMMYFRFKIAANTLLWPLTTLGMNEGCGQHLFTALPGLVFYYFLSFTAVFDLLYTVAVYFVTICCKDSDKMKKVKTFLTLPWVLTTMFAFGGFMLTLAKASWTVVFGFKFDIGFKFELSAQWGMFTLLYLVLSFMEFVNFVVKVVKGALKASHFVEDAKSSNESPANAA